MKKSIDGELGRCGPCDFKLGSLPGEHGPLVMCFLSERNQKPIHGPNECRLVEQRAPRSRREALIADARRTRAKQNAKLNA